MHAESQRYYGLEDFGTQQVGWLPIQQSWIHSTQHASRYTDEGDAKEKVRLSNEISLPGVEKARSFREKRKERARRWGIWPSESERLSSEVKHLWKRAGTLSWCAYICCKPASMFNLVHTYCLVALNVERIQPTNRTGSHLFLPDAEKPLKTPKRNDWLQLRPASLRLRLLPTPNC